MTPPSMPRRETSMLAEDEPAFRELAENIHEVFWMTDAERRNVLYVSPAFERVWGRSMDSVYEPGFDWADTISPHDRERARHAFLNELPSGRFDIEYRIERPDGEVRWIHDRGFPVRDDGGDIKRAVGIAEDVTERRYLQHQLILSQKMEGIGRLASGIAHDFNNVLTLILGHSQMMLEQVGEDSPLHGDLKEIQTAAKRAAALTGQLLAFSRQQVLNLVVVDLNVVVSELEQMLRRLIGEDVEVKARTAPDHCPVKADPAQLEQILINLAVNARDAMPRGGILRIETSHETFAEDRVVDGARIAAGKYEVLVVQDNGSGMDEHTKARLFEPFFTTKAKGKGTGLGLATVYGTVKQLEGLVFVESQPQHGTTFKIYFPRTDAPLQPRTAEEHEVSSKSGNEVILVVEDDESVRRFAITVLARYGYHLLEAATPDRAISVSEEFEGRIDLVLTDIVMPGINGDELARLVKAQRPEVKLLYISGYTELARTLGSEVQARLLPKPFSPDTLLHRVRRALDSGVG